MPYVQRDATGAISAVFQEPQQGVSEFVAGDHPDLQIFLGAILPQSHWNQASEQLSETDTSLIRVIEDIIDVLIDKNVIMFTDLPQAARDKIMERKTTRERMSRSAPLIDPEDHLF